MGVYGACVPVRSTALQSSRISSTCVAAGRAVALISYPHAVLAARMLAARKRGKYANLIILIKLQLIIHIQRTKVKP